jgi:hypothetical protein
MSREGRTDQRRGARDTSVLVDPGSHSVGEEFGAVR